MLTRTSELAIKTLVYLTLTRSEEPRSPRQIAGYLHCSSSYLAKVLRILVGVGILRSVRGVHGGVVFQRDPADVTLLAVVEACQGVILGDYCDESEGDERVCSYHVVMKQLHRVVVETLSSCTIQDLMEVPARCTRPPGSSPCKMAFAGCEDWLRRMPDRGFLR